MNRGANSSTIVSSATYFKRINTCLTRRISRSVGTSPTAMLIRFLGLNICVCVYAITLITFFIFATTSQQANCDNEYIFHNTKLRINN